MLANGQLVGHYRIVSPLGAGGMGEVYLAEDTRLRRRVAFKVLPAALTQDGQSRRRLLREARAAAALDHPNICTVYEVGEADGQSFIAMQFVDGETLAARLKRGPLDPSIALDVATQIAAALAEAHHRGIVHRDVKPQNVMLTTGNQAKVLDFGLAHVTHAPDGDTRTLTLMTDAGTVAGTAAYMSPEQVRGEALDARSDIFSFGCVLYEMFAGRSPFLGPTAADSMSAVLTHHPSPLPHASVTPDLQQIVGKCLDKHRERRYQTTRDLFIDLEAVRGATGDGSHRRVAPATRVAPRNRRAVAAAAGALLVIAAAAVAYFYLRSARPLRLSPGDFIQITALPDEASAPALSPDGRMVAFIRGDEFLGSGQIYVKLLPDGDPVKLTDDPRPKYGTTFAPDGSRVAYTIIDQAGSPSAGWETWTVPVLGGAPARLLPNAAGLTWLDPNHVMFSEVEPGRGLHMGVVTSTEDRRNERRIYFPAELRAMAHYSYLSPDRQWVLIVEMDRTGDFGPCRVVPFDGTGAARTVGPVGSCTSAAWSPDGHWMYFSVGIDGSHHLWRQRFPSGAPSQITSGPATQERGVAVTPDGRSLITSVGQSFGSLWVHEPGGVRLVPLDGSVSAPRMSRDGTRVYALVRRVGEPSSFGLTVVELASGRIDRLLTEFPIIDFDISRDEQLVAFTVAAARDTREMWLASLDRRLPPRRVATDGDQVHFGRPGELVYRALTGTANALTRVGTDGRGAKRLSSMAIIDVGEVSPDGEWAILAAPSLPGPSVSGPGTFAIGLHSGIVKQLCPGVCSIVWAPGTGTTYVATRDATGNALLMDYSAAPGEVLPDLPPDWASRHASVDLLWNEVAPGPDPSVYVFTRTEERGNLFRVPLR